MQCSLFRLFYAISNFQYIVNHVCWSFMQSANKLTKYSPVSNYFQRAKSYRYSNARCYNNNNLAGVLWPLTPRCSTKPGMFTSALETNRIWKDTRPSLKHSTSSSLTFWPYQNGSNILQNCGDIVVILFLYFYFRVSRVCECVSFNGSSLLGRCGGPQKDRLVCLRWAQQTIWL